ncbi:MAG: hypothetical protein AAF730_11015 [Bacteroidota bacterium]
MPNDTTALRDYLIGTAVSLYSADGEPLTARRISEAAGVPQTEFYSVFDHIDEVLPAYYASRIDAFVGIRDGIAEYDSFSLDERISTFIFVMFDLFEADAAFVQQSYAPLLAQGRLMGFRDRIAETYAALLDASDIPALNQTVTSRPWLHQRLAKQYLSLLNFWCRDASPQREQTTALVDKYVAFFADVATFRGVERGVDLVRYLQQVGEINVRWIPFVGRYLAGDETE